MPTHEQLQAAVQKALAAGDQAAVDDLQQRLAATPKTVDEDTRLRAGLAKAHAAGDQAAVADLQQRLLDVQKSVSAVQQGQDFAKQSTWDKVTTGMGHGALRVADKMLPLSGRFKRAEDEKAGVNATLMANPQGRTGDAVGAGMAAAVPGLALGGLTRALPLSVGGAAEGAAQGALTAQPGQEGKGALGGALGGGVVGGALGAGNRLLTGAVKATPEAQRLMSQGADLSMGQIAGPHSAVGIVENATSDVPLVSTVTTKAKDRGLRTIQQAAGRNVVPPGGQFTPGANAVEEANDLFHNQFPAAYAPIKAEQVFPAIHNGKGGVPLRQAAHDAIDNADLALDPQQLAGIHAIVDRKLDKVLPQKGFISQMEAGKLTDVRHDFRTLSRGFKRSGLHGDVQQGLAYDAAADAVTQALDSQLPPASAAALKAIDQKYAQFALYEDAVARGQNMEGGFRPQQFQQAETGQLGRRRVLRYAEGGNHDLMGDAKLALQEAPKTGGRVASLGVPAAAATALHAAGGVGVPAAAAVSGAALALPLAASLAGNASPTAKRLLLGATPLQGKARLLTKALDRLAPDAAATTAGAAGSYLDPLKE